MKIIISAKDSVSTKFEFDVACWYHDYGAFHIVWPDGTIRVYPDRHILYIEQKPQSLASSQNKYNKEKNK